MNNERYNQIIDEAYENYCKGYWELGYLQDKIFNGNSHYEHDIDEYILEEYSKEEFIDESKAYTEFSQKWGLKIEERELSLGERGELFRKEYPNKSVDDFAPSGMEVQSLNHQLNTRYNNANIPTKLLTVIYNNEIIDVYE